MAIGIIEVFLITWTIFAIFGSIGYYRRFKGNKHVKNAGLAAFILFIALLLMGVIAYLVIKIASK